MMAKSTIKTYSNSFVIFLSKINTYKPISLYLITQHNHMFTTRLIHKLESSLSSLTLSDISDFSTISLANSIDESPTKRRRSRVLIVGRGGSWYSDTEINTTKCHKKRKIKVKKRIANETDIINELTRCFEKNTI
jgi:hypothetical protein